MQSEQSPSLSSTMVVPGLEPLSSSVDGRETPVEDQRNGDMGSTNGKFTRRFYVEELVTESQMRHGENMDGHAPFLKHFDMELDPEVVNSERSDSAG
jgi:hypothetical protein